MTDRTSEIHTVTATVSNSNQRQGGRMKDSDIEKELLRERYLLKNKNRRLQDRRSQGGKRARLLRRQCKGAFGHMKAIDYNDRALGTPGAVLRDEQAEAANARVKLTKLIPDTYEPDPQTKIKPRKNGDRPKRKKIPDQVRFDKAGA